MLASCSLQRQQTAIPTFEINELRPVSIQKRGILAKIKEREDCNHRNTLKYFEDYNLMRDAACPAIAFGDGGRLAKRAVSGWTLD
jgi:hypothetical protein